MHGGLDKLKSLLKLEWRGTMCRIFVTVATSGAAAACATSNFVPGATAAVAAYTGNYNSVAIWTPAAAAAATCISIFVTVATAAAAAYTGNYYSVAIWTPAAATYISIFVAVTTPAAGAAAFCAASNFFVPVATASHIQRRRSLCIQRYTIT